MINNTLKVLFIAFCIVNIIDASLNISPFFQSNLKFEEDATTSDILSQLNREMDVGEALKLSKYLDNPKLGKRLSCVDLGIEPFGSCSNLDSEEGGSSSSSPFTYSGFFTVNETYDSNLFYWFFEAQNGDKNAPLLIWLQGGPGGASTFGLFVENGPISLLPNLTLVTKNITWNTNYAMLYIDNPVGTGFSYTNSDEGYSNTEEEIAANLYSLLVQFYKIYPEYESNDLYLTGESYAGKYIPSFAYYILQQNAIVSNSKVNLVGISIGDGLIDPISQVTQYANLAFYTGLADLVQQEVMTMYQDKIIYNIIQENWMEANDLFTQLINGPPDYFQNITGNPDYYDIRRTVEPTYGGNFEAYLNSSSIRALLHVGNNYFQNNNNVYLHLQEDIPKSVIHYLPTLIENIKVLLYNGQFDFIVGVSLTETMIRTIGWEGIYPFILSNRIIWKIPSDQVDVAGYVRQYENLTQVVVRDCGHICPYDEPARMFDLITRFVDNLPFPTGPSSSSSASSAN